jgi:hypothetical protein
MERQIDKEKGRKRDRETERQKERGIKKRKMERAAGREGVRKARAHEKENKACGPSDSQNSLSDTDDLNCNSSIGDGMRRRDAEAITRRASRHSRGRR